MQFGPPQKRIQNERSAAQFGAVQIVMEMQMSSAQSGSVRPRVPMEKPQVALDFPLSLLECQCGFFLMFPTALTSPR